MSDGVQDQAKSLSLSRQELRKRLLDSLGESIRTPPTLKPQVSSANAQEQAAPFPMLDLQKAYWMGRVTDGVACHGYLELDIDDLDLPRFERAFNLVIERHPALRSIFDEDGRQRILPSETVHYEIPLSDLRAVLDAPAKLLSTRAELAQQVLPADEWPLFDVRVSRISELGFRVHVSIDVMIADAQSFQILAHELLEYYADLEAHLPPIEVTFRDYVIATQTGARDGLAGAREYWLERVPHLPSAPDLPSMSPIGQLSFRRIEAHVPQDAWAAIVTNGRTLGVGAASIAFAAFAEALGVWAASPQFTVNLTQFNREPIHPHIDRVVGSFTNSTLVEVDLSSGVPFSEFVAWVQRRMWESLEHRAFSGVQILRELHRSRGSSSMPIVFTYVQASGDHGDFRSKLGAFGDVSYAVSQTPQVWLDCQISESVQGLDIWWDFDERVFENNQINEMFQCFVDLVMSLVSNQTWATVNPATSPKSVGELRESTERTASLDQVSLWDLFVRTAEEFPFRVAVVQGKREVTYGGLLKASRSLSTRLRCVGARDKLVAVHVERGWEQVAAVLGVLGAGCPYLPIDTLLPSERIRRLQELGKVEQVISDRVVPSGSWTTLTVENKDPSATVEDAIFSLAPDDLAYVIFTSGSTGDPKGVKLQHEAVVNTLLDINRRFGVSGDDRVLGVSSIGFDLSVWDMFGIFAAGGTLVTTAPGQAAKDPVLWLTQMIEAGVTIWNSAPALLEMLVTEAENREVTLPDLRLILLSGDWISLDLPARIRKIAPGADLYSLGGATEAAIWSVFYKITEVDPGWKSIPYGFPLTNQSLLLLDWAGRERPVGAIGELHIGGRGVADGYWDAPNITDSVFSKRDGERLYRTGDLARRSGDGCIELLGRLDSQVKIQGHRIELGEIDIALVKEMGVRSSVTQAVGARDGHRQLVSLVVVEEPGTSADLLRERLMATLPPYMVPSRILIRPELPVTLNGKIDLKLIQELAVDALESNSNDWRPRELTDHKTGDSSGIVPPGPIAQYVLQLVRDQVRVPTLNASDDLLLAGMDSIHLVRLSGALERELAFRPQLENILKTPTPAALALMFEADIVERLRVGQRFTNPEVDYEILTDVDQREHFRSNITRRPLVDKKHSRVTLRRTSDTSSSHTLTALARGAIHQLFTQALPRLLELGDEKKPIRCYVTPGNIAAVRAYVWLREAPSIELSQGIHAIDPLLGELIEIDKSARVSGNGFDPFVYRPVFDRSPFAVFLVADYAPYRTLYGPDGLRFAAIEAGALSQVITDAMRPDYSMRVVPIVDKEQLGIDERSFDGGEIILALLLDTQANDPELVEVGAL